MAFDLVTVDNWTTKSGKSYGFGYTKGTGEVVFIPERGARFAISRNGSSCFGPLLDSDCNTPRIPCKGDVLIAQVSKRAVRSRKRHLVAWVHIADWREPSICETSGSDKTMIYASSSTNSKVLAWHGSKVLRAMILIRERKEPILRERLFSMGYTQVWFEHHFPNKEIHASEPCKLDGTW